jgi:transcription elongation factor GreA
MVANTKYITKEKKVELEGELKELQGPKRKAVLEALEYAKSLGDLSENAEYHQAREEQALLESRIKKIEHMLRTCEVVSSSGGDTVHIGSKVKVEKDGDGSEKVFLLVGEEEADMQEGKISNRSPFGQALFGKKKGDCVKFSTPRGEVNYKIIDVS